MDLISKKNFIIDFVFTSIIFGLFFIIGRFTLEYLTPFVLAVFVAYFVQKPASALEKKLGISKGMCAMILSAALYLLSVALIVFILYRFFVLSGGIIKDLPNFFSSFFDFFSEMKERFEGLFEQLPDFAAEEIRGLLKGSIKNLTADVTEYISLSAAKIIRGIPSFLFSSIVALVASCYISKDYDRLKEFLKGVCGIKIYGKLVKIKGIFSMSVFKLLKGYLLLGIITYSQLLIGFFILKIRYAPLIALLVSLVDLLPVLGTGTVLVPWGILLLAAGNGGGGIGMLVLYFVIVIVRNFAEPKIIGSQIGINPLFTLLAMFIGLKLFGFWGLILLPVILIVTIEYYRKENLADKR